MKRIPTGYSLHECPPAKETALLSIQQIIVAVFNVIPVPLLIGAGIGLSASEITLLVAGCLLVTGLATILQCLGAGPPLQNQHGVAEAWPPFCSAWAPGRRAKSSNIFFWKAVCQGEITPIISFLSV